MLADIICAWAPSFLAVFLSRALCHQNRRREESGSATSLPSVGGMDRSSSTENGGKNITCSQQYPDISARNSGLLDAEKRTTEAAVVAAGISPIIEIGDGG